MNTAGGPQSPAADWIFCQIGAREHYVLPAQFHRMGRLATLYTDLWSPPGSVQRRLRLKGLGDRYTPALANAPIKSFTPQALAFEAGRRAFHRTEGEWPRIMARNAWFQRQVLTDLPRTLRPGMTVFSYAYAARDIFRAARDAGCRTVLGQIDPGISEENIVAEACALNAELAPRWARAPQAYWNLWREECALADHIIVNSEWSRTGLVQAGIKPDNLTVVPLAYEDASQPTIRSHPGALTAARPLRVLFLGSLIIRKGVAELLDAVRRLAGRPVEFLMVGSLGVTPRAGDLTNPQIRWIGPVGRGEVSSLYDQADVFILPSLSDGFGLTMIEAQARGLPVIASRHCGDVVEDGVNGLLLPEVSGEAIAAAINRIINSPALLSSMSKEALKASGRLTPMAIGAQLASL